MVNGALDGNSIQQIAVDTLMSTATGAMSAGSGPDFVRGGSLLNEAAQSFGNAYGKRIHPKVRKAAKKTIKKARKAIGKSAVSSFGTDLAYGAFGSASHYYFETLFDALQKGD